MNKTIMHQEILNSLRKTAQTLEAMAVTGVGDIEVLVSLVTSVLKDGGKVVLLGNGGSAADAQHIAAELVGRFAIERQAFPAIALTTNSSIITAIGNDYGYDKVFSRQVEAIVNANDIVIGITTSGNSLNVLEALKVARTKGAKTVGLTGENGAKLANVTDLTLTVPSSSTPRIQEVHITVGHIVCELVEKELSIVT